MRISKIFAPKSLPQHWTHKQVGLGEENTIIAADVFRPWIKWRDYSFELAWFGLGVGPADYLRLLLSVRYFELS